MRIKMQKLTEMEQKERFKEAIFNLDPALSLNDGFIVGIKDFQKRYGCKTHHFKFVPDKYRKIEGRSNSTGTRVSLKLIASGFEMSTTWHKYKVDKNTEAKETYSKFKDAGIAARESNEADEKQSALKETVFRSLKTLIPNQSKISIRMGYSNDIVFTMEIRDIPQEKLTLVINKIKDLV